MRRPSVVLVGWAVFVLSGLLFNCGGGSNSAPGGDGDGDGDDSLCASGETRACVGPGACEGGQACEADGQGWTPCDCGEPASGGSNPGTGGTGTGGLGGADASGGQASSGGQTNSGGAPAEDCEPMSVESCPNGKRCDVISSGEPGFEIFERACLDAGTAVSGEDCSTNTECVAGTACGKGTCREFCDVNGGCGSDEMCVGYEFSGGVLFDVCEPTCSVLGDDCPETQHCLPSQSSAVCVVSVVNAPLGEPCSYANGCEGGAICKGLGALPGVCTAVCDSTLPDPCVEPGDICVPLPLFAEYSEFAQFGPGICVACTLSPGECALLQAGGCTDSAECASISAAFERSYSCTDNACAQTPEL